MAIYLKNGVEINDIIKSLTSGESMRRRSEAYKDQQVLDGLQLKHINERLKVLYPKSYKFLRVSDIQITKKIIEKRARAYASAPTRRGASEAETEALTKFYKQGNFDAGFEAFDRSYNYYNYGFLWVIPVVNDMDYYFKIRNLRPFEFDMIFDLETGEPWAFAMCYGSEKNNGVSTRFAVWTQEKYFDFECFGYNFASGTTRDFDVANVQVQNEMLNFLGVLPGAYLQNDTAPGFPVRNNLVDRSIEWNVGMTDVKTAIAVQGMGIPTIKHDQDIEVDEEIELGKSKMLKLPQPKDKDSFPTDFDFVMPKPNINDSLEVLRFELQMILEDNGIRGKSIVAPTSVEQFSSGFDRLISEADVQYIINKNQNAYAGSLEQQIFKVVKAYDNAFSRRGTFSQTEDIEVFFDKPKVLISDRETLENLSMRLTLGTLLPWEKHIILNPNLTEKEAREREKAINASGIKEEMNPPKPGMEGEGSANKKPVTNQSQAVKNGS